MLNKCNLNIQKGRNEVMLYTDQIEVLIKDFHNNGPGSVNENLELGVSKLEVRCLIIIYNCMS